MSTHSESPFCASVPTLLRAWDNTAISLLKECPRKFLYSMVQGWRPKHAAAPLAFGGFLHEALEFYDRLRVSGAEHAEAQAKTVHEFLLRTVTREQGRLEERATPEGVTQVFVPDPSGPDTSLTFWFGDNVRTRQTLIRSIIWYTEQFCATGDPLQTVTLSGGKPALEVSFRFELPLTSPDGEPYLYSGNIDKIAKMGEDYYVQERKHTASTISFDYFNRFSPDGQTAGYQAAAEILLGAPVHAVIIDATQVAVNFSRVHRHIATKSPAVVNEWLQNTLDWIRLAEHFAKSNTWPMNETACHKFSGCQFRAVCSRDPAMRPTLLESNFHKSPWNPLHIRGGEDA